MADKLKCIWNMGDACSDDVELVSFFMKEKDGKKVPRVKDVPVCKNHIEGHRIVLVLHKNGYDLEDFLQKDFNYRKEQYLVLKLAGLDDSAVDL
jgi:hypothetical protein